MLSEERQVPYNQGYVCFIGFDFLIQGEEFVSYEIKLASLATIEITLDICIVGIGWTRRR